MVEYRAVTQKRATYGAWFYLEFQIHDNLLFLKTPIKVYGVADIKVIGLITATVIYQ